MTSILKFGGTSLISAKAFSRVANIVVQKQQPIVVLSAMYGITNMLIETIKLNQAFQVNAADMVKHSIFKSHIATSKELIHDTEAQQAYAHFVHHKLECNVASYSTTMHTLRHNTDSQSAKFAYDRVSCLGEIFSSKLMACYLNDRGIAADVVYGNDIILTCGTPMNARPLPQSDVMIRNVIDMLEDAGSIPIVTGFFGVSKENHQITTFGRSGSDLTATIVAQAIDAKDIHLFKVEINDDGDWIPGLIGIVNYDTKDTIPHMSFKDVITVANNREVLHKDSIRPIYDNDKIVLYVKNTLEPEKTGTMVTRFGPK